MQRKISDSFFLTNAKEEHLDDVVEIEQRSSPDPWKRDFFRSEIFAENSFFLVCINKKNRNTGGFIVFRNMVDFIEINNIAVREELRRSGIGKLMMKKLFDIAEINRIKDIFLEVRESNLYAIAFYRNFGFVEVAKRKSYYNNPSEDALVLKKIL